jgi:Ca2+-binding RTX toxin-like protein
VNDAPAGTDKTVTTAEDTPYTFTVADFGFNDSSDTPANALQAVKITTLPTGGTLTDNGVVVTVGQFISVADITSGKLVFTPALNANSPPTYSFTFQVQDNGGTANGGVDLDQSANTLTFSVSAVNDAPVNTVPAAQTTNEDTSKTIAGLSISDVDASPSTLTVTLSVAHGTLTVATVGGGAPTLTGSGTATVTLTGTAAQINTSLSGSNVTYFPTGNYSGSDTLTMTTSDLGHTGTGGVKTDTDTVAISVTAVNDPPIATADTLYISNNTNATFSASTLLGNDNNTDGPSLSIQSIGPVTGGVQSATINPDGTIAVTTTNAASGTFVYIVSDGAGGTATATVTVNIPSTNGSANAVDLSIQTYQGSYIDGRNGEDALTGGGSAQDIFIGGAANDTLKGGAGNDTLQGGAGNDSIDGGAGIDLIDLSDANAFSFTLGAGGNGTATASGTDSYSNMEGVIGGGGNDVLNGNADDNVLVGGGGADTLSGGVGADTLTGGAASDRFVFRVGDGISDVITDFNASTLASGGDILDISDLLIGFTTSSAAQFIQLIESGGNTTVSVDRDGAASGFAFQDVFVLQGVTGLNLNTLLTQGNIDPTPGP